MSKQVQIIKRSASAVSTKFLTVELRGKVCRRIILPASKNDIWNMRRFQAINGYLANLEDKGRDK
jgi:hypothetical protein